MNGRVQGLAVVLQGFRENVFAGGYSGEEELKKVNPSQCAGWRRWRRGASIIKAVTGQVFDVLIIRRGFHARRISK